MRREVIACFVVMFILGPHAPIMAVEYDSTITGKGDATADVAAVQKAVDQGGSILLKGVFDFGEKGRVNITKDVDIQGELDARGAPATKILGGMWTFHAPLPARLPPTAPGPKIGIRNIHFQGALWNAIHLNYSGGVDVVNNTITDVARMDTKTIYFGKEGIHRQQGIIFYPPYTLPKEHGKYMPGVITGTVTIADNHIDLSNDAPEATVGQGILVVGSTGANIRILRNRVVNASRNAIESIDNYPGEDGGGSTLIKDNTIITGEKGLALPSPSTPNGVVTGWFLDPAGAADPARSNKIIVTGNRIDARGASSMGILVLSDGAVISSNHIQLKGAAKAKGVMQLCSNAVIADNTFEGAGLVAVMVTPFKKLAGAGNTLVNNEFTGFKATAANVLINSSKNIVIGKSDRVIDKGKMNRVVATAAD